MERVDDDPGLDTHNSDRLGTRFGLVFWRNTIMLSRQRSKVIKVIYSLVQKFTRFAHQPKHHNDQR